MRYNRTKVGDFTAVGNVDLELPGVEKKTYQFIFGGAAATMQILGSIDGTNFVQIGADITADALRYVNDVLSKVRIRCNAYTSGTVTVWAGHGAP